METTNQQYNECPFRDGTEDDRFIKCRKISDRTEFPCYRQKETCDECFAGGEHKKEIEKSPVLLIACRQFLKNRLLQGALGLIQKTCPINIVKLFKKFQAISMRDEQKRLFFEMLSRQCKKADETSEFSRGDVVEKLVEIVHACGLEEVEEELI